MLNTRSCAASLLLLILLRLTERVPTSPSCVHPASGLVCTKQMAQFCSRAAAMLASQSCLLVWPFYEP